MMMQYYRLRDEIFVLEQKLIRILNFQLNSLATPAMVELLSAASENLKRKLYLIRN